MSNVRSVSPYDGPLRCGLPNCSALIAGDDPHRICIACLGVAHAFNALQNPGNPDYCAACSRYSEKFLRARYGLARECLGGSSSSESPAITGPLHRGDAEALDASGVSGSRDAPQQHSHLPPSTSVATGGGSHRSRHHAGAPPPPPSTTGSVGRGASLPKSRRDQHPTTAAVSTDLHYSQPHRGHAPSAAVVPDGSLLDQHISGLPPSPLPLQPALPNGRFQSPADDYYSGDEEYSGGEEEEEDGEGELPCYQVSSVMRSPSPEHRADSGATAAAHIGAAISTSSPLPSGSSGQLSLQGPGEATDETPSTTTLSVSSAFERAVARCGQQLPVEEKQASSSAPTPVFPGMVAPEPRQPPVRRLPVAIGFKENLQGHADPRKLPFNIVAGADDLGLAIPPMDPVLAASLNDQIKGRIALFPKPTLTVPKDKAASGAAERSFKATALVTKALNASTLLQGSLSLMLQDLKHVLGEQAEEIELVMQLIIQLNQQATQWTGRTMDLCAMQERSRWLDLVTFSGESGQETRKHLMGLDLDAGNLFKGGAEFLKTSTELRKAQCEAASGVFEPPPPPPNPKSRMERPAARGRSTSRQTRSGRPQTSPAPGSQGEIPRRRWQSPPGLTPTFYHQATTSQHHPTPSWAW